MSYGLKRESLAAAPQGHLPGLRDLAAYPDRRLYTPLPVRILQKLLGFGRRAASLMRRGVTWLRFEWRELRSPSSRILRDAAGYVPASGRAICLYASFSESDQVTEMVLRQLEEYTLLGFDVIFVTSSRDISQEDWEAVRARCTLALQRRNYGLDFGSWSDAAREVQERIASAEELLLTNDSVLGPIRPLAPVFAALRSGGDGLFGLTESLQHAVHLQSYLLLARGKGAVGDVLAFLLNLRLSGRKAAIIRRGELSISKHMAKRGHRVAALYGYTDLEAAVLADRKETGRMLSFPFFASTISVPLPRRGSELRQAMLHIQMNPTHHLWAPLIRLKGFPFIKTELVTKNPAAVPDAVEWESLVPPDAPCPLPVLHDHLARRQRQATTP